MKQTKTDLLNGPIYKQILIFFFPIMIGTFFQQLYNTVDAVVVGNFVGKAALAAVGGSTGITINLLVSFAVGLAGGATVIVAQSYGARDLKGIYDGVKSGMFLGIVLGLILMIFGIIFTPGLLRILNAPSDMFDLAVSYMRIYLTGTIPVMIYNVGASVLRAIGDSKRPLYFLIVSCAVNIVLDVFLVTVLKMGVNGAALATVISQIVAAFLVIKVLSNKEAPYYYNFKDFGYEKETLKRIIVIGLPTGIQSVLYSVSNLFIQAKVNMFGTDTIAAFTAFGKIDALFWMMSGAFGQATLTMAGQCYGARKYGRVKRTCLVAWLLEMVSAALISLLCCLTGEYLYNLFTNDINVIKNGMEILLCVAPFWITFSFIEISSSTIRACGESLRPMLFVAFGVCLLRIVWIMLYPLNSVTDVLRCYPISWIVTTVMFVIYYLRGKWLKIEKN